MHLVKCDYTHWDFVKFLRSHPDVQSGFIDYVTDISKIQQTQYMSKNWEYFWVLCDKDYIQYGYIGLINNDKDEITYCIDPKYQGLGYGKLIVEKLISKNSNKNIWAKVKKNNIPSCKVFEKLDYFKYNYEYIKNSEIFKIYSSINLTDEQIKLRCIHEA